MFKTIIFDLGRVLVHFDFTRGYRAMEKLCPYSSAEIPKRLAPTGLVELLETGGIEPRAFVSSMNEVLSIRELDYQGFCDIWSSIFTETLLPESMVERLGERYRLLLLSNTNAIHFDMIRATYPILRHFHHCVLSYEVGAAKPDRKIYEAALAAAHCRPEECFYTDDIADYVRAGREIGFDAVQFESAAQIQREMRSRGISWDDSEGTK
jgi:glucose-1-phosphatase